MIKKEKTKSFARFIGIAAQMGVTIFLGAYLGKYLDEKYPSNKKWFTIGLTLLAVFVALYNVLRQLNKQAKEDEQSNS